MSYVSFIGTSISIALMSCVLPCSATHLTFDGDSTTDLQAVSGLKIKVRSGQHAVVGASIQLYEADLTTYTGTSTELLSNPGITNKSGNYVFSTVPACSPDSLVYFVATGGDAGGGNDPSIALMTAVGSCKALAASSSIVINEATTVASTYALSGFMSSLGSVSANATVGTNNGTERALIGITNAFTTVHSLVGIHTGVVRTMTPAGNGTVPQAKIGSLGNLLAACIQSAGFSSAACSGLSSNAKSPGGIAPTDTVQAMLNIAHSPGSNIAALYTLSSSSTAYAPTLSAVPNDWTMPITYTASALINPAGIAIDGRGDIWITDSGLSPSTSSVLKLKNNGAILSGTSGFTGGGLLFPRSIAIGLDGAAWVLAGGGMNGNIVKLASDGTVLSGTEGFNGTNINGPGELAIDGKGDVWVTLNGGDIVPPSVIKLSKDGTILSGKKGYTAGGMNSPGWIAIDSAGEAWISNNNDLNVTKLSSKGAVLSGTTGFLSGGNGGPPGTITIDSSGNALVLSSSGRVTRIAPDGDSNLTFWTCFAGQQSPTISCPDFGAFSMVLDGTNNIWAPVNYRVFNSPGSTSVSGLSEFSSTGSMLSVPLGYNGPNYLAEGIAIDSSGNTWTIFTGAPVTELVGAATPVATPLSVAVRDGVLGQHP
ncbi:NHL repeat-containing protein [Granulicella arctica]|uniref:NHL repeat-containing protein n=1 Tax=Granulicella arctica TaxID=940613 RepID=UPI0021E0E277|nr:NHL repeat-containing protein [Granulicella arctica]